eukprot:gene11308-4119_t
MSVATQQAKPDIDVNYEDQIRINDFNRLHLLLSQYEVDIEDSTEENEKIGDALDEIYLTDDIKLSVGDSFINIQQDEVEEILEERKSKITKEVQAKKKNIEEIKKKMKSLKAELYAKFGTNINLDYGE